MPLSPATYVLKIVYGAWRFEMPFSEERARYCGVDLDKREIAAGGVLLDLDGVTFALPRGLLRYVPEPDGVPWEVLWRALCELAGVPIHAKVEDPRAILELLEYATRLGAHLPRPPRGKGRPPGTGPTNARIDEMLAQIRASKVASNAGKQPHHKYCKPTLKDGIRAAPAGKSAAGLDRYARDRKRIERWLRPGKPNKPSA